jgi:hypothetical protein
MDSVSYSFKVTHAHNRIMGYSINEHTLLKDYFNIGGGGRGGEVFEARQGGSEIKGNGTSILVKCDGPGVKASLIIIMAFRRMLCNSNAC